MTRFRDDVERQRDFVLGVGLFALAAIVYLPTANHDFVNWDDPWYVLKNPTVKSWSPTNLLRLATTAQVRNYAPLTMYSFLIDHTLWGTWAGGYHLTNAWLHAVNTVLVFVLVRQFGTGRFVAATTAVLFAVHPVHVESVVWISARKGLLSGTFVLASLICWMRRHRTAEHEAWGILWLFLALASKAIAVVVPAVVLLYDLWVRRERLTAALPRQVVPAFLACCLLALTMNAQNGETGGVREHLEFSRAYLIALDGPILWEYVAHLVNPRDLSVLYDPPTTGIAGWITLSWAGWIAVGVLVFALRDRLPLAPFCLVSSLLFLLPVLNLFPLTTLMNDRYLYLPSIPLFALAAGGLEFLLQLVFRDREGDVYRWWTWRRAVRGTAFAAAAIAVAVSLLGRTQAYTRVWRDDLVLWRHAREHAPNLPVVRIQLALALRNRGFDAESVAELESTLAELTPDEADECRIRRMLNEWRARPTSA